MPVTLPTKPGQGVGAFLDELRDAATSRVLASQPSRVVESGAWVILEDDSLTDGECVAELHGAGECRYFRLTYARVAAGLAIGDPVEVAERKTYEPVAPPATLARAVLCESLPVHAPPAEGLTPGRPVQILRLGPVHDVDTGAKILDVTDELCRSVAETASGTGLAVPVDEAHKLFRGEPTQLFGRLSHVEARPGSGLWGTPEWTPAGAALLASSPGLYYLSPTLLAPPKDPRTGLPMAGRLLHSVSLTATPRQDALDSVALSRPTPKEALMGNPSAAGAPPDVVTLSRDDHAALLARVTGAEGRATELEAQLKTKDANEATLLSRIEAVEAREAAAALARKVELARDSGKHVPDAVATLLSRLPVADQDTLLASIPATIPTSPAGHGRPVGQRTQDEIDCEAIKLSRDKGIDLPAAYAQIGGAR